MTPPAAKAARLLSCKVGLQRCKSPREGVRKGVKLEQKESLSNPLGDFGLKLLEDGTSYRIPKK